MPPLAAPCHAADADMDKAGSWAVIVRRRSPSLTQADFFRSFPFGDLQAKARLTEGLARLGI